MEKYIYTDAIARLKSADALAYYITKAVVAPKTYEWFQNQIEQTLGEDVKSCPFDCPALFFEFTPTEYSKGNTVTQEAKGELTIHVAQFTFVDGREGALTHAEFKALLDYADIIADVLGGYRLGCSAVPVLANIQRDHTNRPVMTDKIKFTWTGRRRRELVPAV